MILPWLILIPFIGGFLCWIAEYTSKTLPRWVALGSMVLTLALSLWVWHTGDFQLARRRVASRNGPCSSRYPGSSASASACTWQWTACPC